MKTILPVVVILGIIGVGVLVYSSTQNSSSNDFVQPKATAIQKNDDATKAEDETMGTRYFEYSKAKLDNLKDSRRVLFFYASWCPTCRPADANFSQNETEIPKDVTLIRVNYNDTETDQEEKDLATKYEVTYQHTFVQIDEKGAEVAKWNGGQITELLQNIK